MKLSISSFFVAIATPTVAVDCQATLVNIAFDHGGASFADVDTLPDGTVVSTGTNGAETWNLVSGVNTGNAGGTITGFSLLRADGAPSGATLDATYRNSVNLGGAFVPTLANWIDGNAMMAGLFTMNQGASTITITGFPAEFSAGYSVTVFTNHGDTREVTFTADDGTTMATGSTQQLSNSTFVDDFGSDGVLSVTLDGLLGSGFTLVGASGFAIYKFAGMQISAIPEPSAIACWALVGLPFLRESRKP